jgi:EAL domain-containing protein (putative c-di-GMP-specific phosphodiesterase class I)
VREAVDHDRLVLYAQPIVDVVSRKVVQHELLLRMLSDGEVIAPSEFLPHAERDGLIVDVDRWVIRQAAKLAAEGAPVELNLSAKSIADPTILLEVEQALTQTGADPANLIFELTETALRDDGPTVHAFAEAMKGLGCRLALDHFGTGYGGLTSLKRLPVQYLKIDREFVGDLLEEESSVHVVTAVVQLARSFGYKTVAEGVEQLETMDRLQALGVDYAQGFALGAPAPVRDVIPPRELEPVPVA